LEQKATLFDSNKTIFRGGYNERIFREYARSYNRRSIDGKFSHGQIAAASLAFRYHALPLSRDETYITVAMAAPDDKAACAAIAGVLNDSIYPVRASPTTIDKLLNTVWPLKLLVYHQDSPISQAVYHYAQHLANILPGQLNSYQPDPGKNCSIRELIEVAACGQNLVIFGEPDQGLINRMLNGPTGYRAVKRIPTSVLIARTPRWPIQKILLVSRGQSGMEHLAVDWLIRLAQASDASVTVPGLRSPHHASVPAIPSEASPQRGDAPLLNWQLDQITIRLLNQNIESLLRFRDGPPEKQIQKEVERETYDLVIMADDPADWWQRRLMEEQIKPLLHWIDRPLLIVKSAPSGLMN
jgi:hypothetical protein